MPVSILQEVSDAVVDQGFALYLMGKDASVSYIIGYFGHSYNEPEYNIRRNSQRYFN